MPGKGRLLISYLCPGTIHARTTWPADWQARVPDLRQGSNLLTTEIWTKTLDEARDAKCHKENHQIQDIRDPIRLQPIRGCEPQV
jgi:hypothetical protein